MKAEDLLLWQVLYIKKLQIYEKIKNIDIEKQDIDRVVIGKGRESGLKELDKERTKLMNTRDKIQQKLESLDKIIMGEVNI